MKLPVAGARGRAEQLSLALPAPRVALAPIAPQLTLPTLACLPERVPGRPFWPLFAGLVAAVPEGETVGLKSLETRTYETEPGFLLACSTQRTPSVHVKRLWPRIPEWARTICQLQGHAVALLYISGCRPLKPFPVKGFQGMRYFDKARILEAIAQSVPADCSAET